MQKNGFDHNKNLERFMAVAKRYNLILNQRKCYFNRKRIKLLSYIISKGNIKPDPERLSLTQLQMTYPPYAGTKECSSIMLTQFRHSQRKYPP